MCSKKCDSPVVPGRSLREPTLKNKYMLALGIELSSRTNISMPLSKVNGLISLASVAFVCRLSKLLDATNKRPATRVASLVTCLFALFMALVRARGEIIAVMGDISLFVEL